MVGLEKEDVERLVRHLRESARVDHGQRITLESLSPGHHSVFARALSNVLSTEFALMSFAQIIDGLPIADVAWDIRGNALYGDHPLDEHEDLCPGAMDKARELRKLWDPSTLKFSPKLVRAHRNASEGSKTFDTRLIELVAASVHQLAAHVFNMAFRLHMGDIDSISNWVMPKPPDWKIGWFDIPPRPTLFNHPAYLDYEIYPEGEADMAGYWAEDRILGGAVAFDRRGEEASPSEPPNVYFLAYPC